MARRMLIWSLAVAVIGALSALGGGDALGSRAQARSRLSHRTRRGVRRAPPRAEPGRRGNQLLAERTASRLLEEVPLPEGAQAAGSDESLFGDAPPR